MLKITFITPFFFYFLLSFSQILDKAARNAAIKYEAL